MFGRIVRVPVGEDFIEMDLGPRGEGTGMVTKGLTSPGEPVDLQKVWWAIEGLVLAHAKAGVNVKNEAYVEGLEDMVQSTLEEFGLM